jgi:class 3 adenylate cyclase
MSRHSVGGYPGMCRVHRAELKRLRGDWSEAEAEALSACEELERYRILDGVGTAQYEVGEIHLLMGDKEGAEQAFQRAFEFGFEPQPGLALLRLAQGEKEEAARALDIALASDAGKDLLTRARILPARVEVALALDDLGIAEASSAELDELAARFERATFDAVALTARARIALYRDDPGEAIPSLERALRAWREIEFPYEIGRVRILLGQAQLALGDKARARMELEAAQGLFERLGARPDLRSVEDLLHGLGHSPASNRVTKTFMFSDIVNSTEMVALIGDGAWESLLTWHDRALRLAFDANGGVVVSHTGDGFFVTFDRVDDAVEAAVAVQRKLASHRREHGFSPMVRIGIHTDQAMVDGTDYRGMGVHLASRVGSAAGAGEIVISTSALEAAKAIRFPIDDGRLTELKGITEPVRLHTIDWS